MILPQTHTDSLPLHNGYRIPCIGYGTYKTPADEACEAVKAAVSAGYRHIDTASYYHNEDGVGRGIAECGVPREELFVTTKVWNTGKKPKQSTPAPGVRSKPCTGKDA